MLKLFSRPDLELEKKWWHRFLKTLFIFNLVFIFVSGVFVSNVIFGRLPIVSWRVDIQETLKNYTENSNDDISNTVPGFLKLPGELGYKGKEGNTVFYFSALELADGFWCNKNTTARADGYAHFIKQKYPESYSESVEEIKRLLEKIPHKDGWNCYLNFNKVYSFTKDDLKDKELDIVKYELNLKHYLSGVGLAMVVSIIYYYFMWFIYYKCVIYIMYGSPKR